MPHFLSLEPRSIFVATPLPARITRRLYHPYTPLTLHVSSLFLASSRRPHSVPLQHQKFGLPPYTHFTLPSFTYSSFLSPFHRSIWAASCYSCSSVSNIYPSFTPIFTFPIQLPSPFCCRSASLVQPHTDSTVPSEGHTPASTHIYTPLPLFSLSLTPLTILLSASTGWAASSGSLWSISSLHQQPIHSRYSP